MQPQQPNTTQTNPMPGSDPGQLPAMPTPPANPQQTDGITKTPVNPAANRNPNSTQNTLMVSEIRENMAIMNDGSFRAVVACQSINFDLMSEREREAIEFSYQAFLNSLYFPIQILVRSQRVDIGPYLERLAKIRRSQDNMLLGVLMDDYIAFIASLAQETNIMDKSFYIVVPYYPAGDVNSAVNSSKNLLGNLFSPQKQMHIRINNDIYVKAKDEVKNRVNTVVGGLMQMSVRAVQLNTKQLGELYYNTYNPDTAVREPIASFEDVSVPVVTKGQGEAPQPHLDRGVM